MEELCDLSRSVVDVIGLFINQREHLSRSWRGLFRRVVLAFYNFKCQHKIAMEMDEIHSKILEISTGRPKKAHSRHIRITKPASTYPSESEHNLLKNLILSALMTMYMHL